MLKKSVISETIAIIARKKSLLTDILTVKDDSYLESTKYIVLSL